MQHRSERKPSILVVDDDSSVRRLLCEVLEGEYRCTEVDSAEHALAELETQHFDLVISDINMGAMSGIELVARVRASTPDTVVMVISGNLNLDSPIEAIRSGAFDYIRKPFDLEQVEMAVARAIDHGALLISKRKHEEHLEQLVEERTGKLKFLANHDFLTGLRNRFFFEEELTKALAEPNVNDLAVVFVSMDNFRELRDTFGHRAGDQLLINVAERLSALPGIGEVVARFGGDEFALLLTDKDTNALTAFTESIFATFAQPFVMAEKDAYVSVSIGISQSSTGCAVDGLELLKNAGAALSHARKRGGDNYQLYTSEINSRALKRLEIENSLRGALERGEFELHYQPKVDITTRQILGMEALVRWNHPVRGLVPPLDFIPIAEETGLIVPIGEWVLRTACVQTKQWHDLGFPLHVAVNLSVRQFQQQDLVKAIESIIIDTGFDTACLNLEVTESSIMANMQTAVDILHKLRLTGIKISIDDFGTGHSSLGYLKHLPIDVLKIDKTFVNDVATNPDDAALVTAVITLAHDLRLKVVAEGVETEQQLEFLQKLRCDEWQGYLFSKPLPAASFEKLLTNAAT